MMVMMIAITPSVKAFRRSGFILFPISARSLGDELVENEWVRTKARSRK